MNATEERFFNILMIGLLLGGCAVIQAELWIANQETEEIKQELKVISQRNPAPVDSKYVEPIPAELPGDIGIISSGR